MTKGAINDFTSSYATYIIVVIYVCRKLHWFRPDLSDLVLGVFSSPVRFVIIELDLSHFHELMRDREISKIYYPFPWFVFLFLNFNLSLFKGEKKIPCTSTSSTLVQHVRRWSASTDWVKKVSGTIGSLIHKGSRPPPPFLILFFPKWTIFQDSIWLHLKRYNFARPCIKTHQQWMVRNGRGGKERR